MTAPSADSTQHTPDRILQLGLAFWGSKTLISAVELGLFTLLAKRGAMDGSSIARELGIVDRGGRVARDFLDALVALGMLEREGGEQPARPGEVRADEARYRNTPETDLYLDKAKPTYVGGLLEMAERRSYPYWGSLTEALRTGRPQNEAKHGGSLFAKIYSSPEALRSFLSAMTGVSLGAAKAIAEKFEWEKVRTFCDVGCAQGAAPAAIASRHPHLTGMGFDLPMVRPVFEEYIASFGLSDRVKFVAGNFEVDPLPSADVLIMGHILHDWDLAQKKMLLRKAVEALPAGGALIVHEALIDDERRKHAFGLLMSLNMLVETPGGFDYSSADCAAWMTEAGFARTRVEHLAGPDWMIIGYK